MRYYLLLLLFLAFPSFSFGQTPSAKPSPAPSASPEKTKNFGSSLKKYARKQPRDSQAKQKSEAATDEEVVRIETDLIINDLLVTNRQGNVITGLQKDDFLVTEDGVPQKIEMFSFGENSTLARSIVLILDTSPMQGPYVKRSTDAAKILVDKLAPQDKMAILTDDLKLRADFTQDKTLLKKTLDSLEAKWALNVEFDTLLAALNEMFKEENRQRIVIFQSDGAGIIWLRPDKDAPYPVSRSLQENSGMRYTGEKVIRAFGFSDIKEAIERSRATIYPVIPGRRFIGLSKQEQLARAKITWADMNRFWGWKELPPSLERHFQLREVELRTAGQTAMFKVAEVSGGFADFLEAPEDAENVYANIFTVIKTRYLVGYYPTNRKRDGKRRQVTIEVRGHPEFTVTGRKAYFLQ